VGIGKSKGGNLYQFSFDSIVHFHHPNPMHSKQILTALFQTVSSSPRFAPYAIISADMTRTVHWSRVLLECFNRCIVVMDSFQAVAGSLSILSCKNDFV